MVAIKKKPSPKNSPQTRYDAEQDIFMITVNSGNLDHAEKRGDLITHYDANGNILLIEVFHAKEKME